MYSLCCFCNETVGHLFMDCEWVRSVCFASHLSVNFSCSNTSAKSFSQKLSQMVVQISLLLSLMKGLM